MKFSIATLAAVVGLAFAKVTTDADALKLLRVPQLSEGEKKYLADNLRALVQNYAAITLPELHPVVPLGDNAALFNLLKDEGIPDMLQRQQDYAEQNSIVDWTTAITLDDTTSAIPILEWLVNDDAIATAKRGGHTVTNAGVVVTKDIKTAGEELLKMYLAQLSAVKVEKENPRVRIIQDYSPVAPHDLVAPEMMVWDNVAKQAPESDFYTLGKQFAAYVAAAQKAHDDLNATLATGDDSVKQVVPELVNKAQNQTDQVTELQNTIAQLQSQLEAAKTGANTTDPKAIEQTVNKSLTDVAQSQDQLVQQTTDAAQTTGSDSLKQISEQLKTQAEEIRKLLGEKPVEITPAPAAETPVASPAAETPAAETPVASPAASPAAETPAVASPAVASPAVASPAVASPAVASPAVETPAVAAETPVATPAAVAAAPGSNAVANSNSNSSSSSSSNSNSNSNSNANANVGIYFINGSGRPVLASTKGLNGTLAGINGTDTYITIYETDCPVTTTDAAGATVVTHTKSSVTSTVCPKCTKTSSSAAAAAEKTDASKPSPTEENTEDVVTVFVTDCPVTTTDAAGSTVVSHSQSTVTSTVCTKCTKKAAETPKAETPKASPAAETPKASPKAAPKESPKESPKGPSPDETIRLTQTLTQTLKGNTPTAPAQAPEHVPAQANGAVKAAAGVAVAIPMVLAALI